MELNQGKLSNYIGQIDDDQKFKEYLVSVDKDLQNIWLKLNQVINYFPGKTYYDINIGSLILGVGTAVPDNVTISSTNIVIKGFDGNVTMEQLYGTIEINHSYKEETDITPHVHWYPTTANVGNVVWQLEYCISKHDGTAITTSTTLTVSSSATGTAWQQIRPDFSVISGTNRVIGEQISFRFFRDPTNAADDYPDDAAVETVGFHVEQDSLGSSGIITK